MKNAYRVFVAMALFSVCGMSGTRAATVARHVTVVNLMSVQAAMEFYESGSNPVASGAVEAKRDHIFDVLPYNGSTYLVVRSSACTTGKRYTVPLKPTDLRIVINAGCTFSIQ